MPLEKVNALKSLVDWFDKISILKKIYAISVIYILLTITQWGIYDNKLTDLNTAYSIRYDSLNYFYNRQLEDCNTETKKNLQGIIKVLENSLQRQEEERIETQRLKIETEKLKIETEKLKRSRIKKK